MRRTLSMVLVWILMLQIRTLAGDLHVGPIYLDKLPKVEVVVELPAQFDETVTVAPQDLTLLEDGQATVSAASIKSFGDDGRKMGVVLVVDVSGTMAGPPIENMKRALLSFMDKAGTNVQVALVTFANDVKVEFTFSDTRDKAQAAVSNLKARGSITELHKALFKALSLFDAPLRKRLLVISDGKDEGKAYTLDDVIREANHAEVLVDAVGMTRIDTGYLSNLERLADLSGGRYVRANNSADLEEHFKTGLDRLQATRVAVFSPRNLKEDGQSHRVGVRWSRNGKLYEAVAQAVFPKGVDPPPGTPLWVWVVLLATLTAGGGVLLWASGRKRSVPASPPPPQLPAPAPASLSSDSQKPAFAAPLGSPPRDSWNVGPPNPPQRLAVPPPPERIEEPAPAGASRRKTQYRVEFPAPQPGNPSAVLVGGDGVAAGILAPIEVNPFWIGAENNNHLCITQDGYLSGNHAFIMYKSGSLFLHDNNSTNGTFVNEEPVQGETPRVLNLGDQLRVGRSVFHVRQA